MSWRRSSGRFSKTRRSASGTTSRGRRSGGRVELRGRTAVVTGGASGIGRALIQRFAREGANVVVADLDDAGMAAVAGEAQALGVKALAVRTDVADLAQVQALAARAFEAFGAVHVLCNNAGVAMWGGLESATHRDWQWVLGVNLWGVIHGVEAFVPRMIARGEPAHIVNTASMAGLIASKGLGVYNTSKYAVVGLSETLAKDLKPYRIGVSVLCPLGVQTQIRQSERNRPAALRNERDERAAPVELIGRSLAPETVADMVLAAIHANELYVITHDESLEPLRRRFERIERSILDHRR
ncbi:MAG: short-chain dehydrogenase [Candidatus Rokuibacteriota bacterium]|nr:MAG: short-chain dehydrogenase [Candidatus Rokubacteria bacterium]